MHHMLVADLCFESMFVEWYFLAVYHNVEEFTKNFNTT